MKYIEKELGWYNDIVLHRLKYNNVTFCVTSDCGLYCEVAHVSY